MLDITQSPPWYVVYTKPSQEERAETELAYQGFSVYLPKISESKRLSGRWIQQVRPMFLRYLFVQPGHAEQSIAPVKSTRGVSHLVRQGASLVACPDNLIDSIRQAEARLAGEGVTACISVGETIEIVEGPFQGLISRVVEATDERACILVDFLGKLQFLQVPVALCRKV